MTFVGSLWHVMLCIGWERWAQVIIRGVGSGSHRVQGEASPKTAFSFVFRLQSYLYLDG